ncbi:Non-structural maintenance of chromosomes element 1 [Rhodotorula toruloides]|nr:Non-structural maintenance of chromosomes element 1 [Rhodotorula toruloides]
MAVHASTSQRRQRAASDASSDAGDARRNKGKRAREAESDEEGDHERDLANLDIKDPIKTCRHLFLQALISRRTMPLDLADALYKECVRLCRVEGPEPLNTFIAKMEPGLALCGLDIKTTRDQESGQGMLVLVNTMQDEPAKLATEYRAEEIAFFKSIVERIMLAPKLSYSITQTDVIRLAKQPVTKAGAIQLLKSFLAKGWLSLHESGRIVLSPRSLVELAPYLREQFDQEEDEAEDARNRTVVDCNLCMGIVTSGYACPNEDCGVRLHTFCVAQRLGNDGRCPDRLDDKPNPCPQIWPRDPQTRKFHGVPIGVAALGLGGDEESDAGATSDVETGAGTPAAAKKKGKAAAAKGRKAAASGKKGKKRTKADEDEVEEDELDEDEESDADASNRQRASSSPAATRKSSRTAKKKRTVQSDDDEEEE